MRRVNEIFIIIMWEKLHCFQGKAETGRMKERN